MNNIKKHIERIALLIGLIIPTLTNAQVRPDINSFTPAQRTQLVNAMMDYITPQIVQYHCDYLNQSGVTGLDIHSDFDFLPFHRVYIEGMEDYLMEQGLSQFVPLPAWNPAGCTPTEFQVVDPDCSTFSCQFGSTSSCSSTINWCPSNSVPAYLQNLCQYNFSPTSPGGSDANGLSRQLETPYHNSVHAGTSGMNGVMGNFRSPICPIFWLWHAFLDDMWKNWECNCSQSTTLPFDLYMKDNSLVMQSERDRGEEPNIDQGPMWESEDIWIRQQNDGFTNHTHQNPEYHSDPNRFNYVYVQVRNRGCVASNGNEALSLYWAKAGTDLSYPSHWNGSLSTITGQPIGDLVLTRTIPSIKPGGSRIIEFQWHVPNPDDYAGLSNDPLFWSPNEPHHFCLLARVQSSADPINFTNGNDIGEYTIRNNNVVWKNFTVVDLLSNFTGGTIFVGHPFQTNQTLFRSKSSSEDISYDIEFEVVENNSSYGNKQGKSLSNVAEISIKLDKTLYDKWKKGGKKAKNLKEKDKDKSKYVVLDTGKKLASLNNIAFSAGERALLYVNFKLKDKKVNKAVTYKFRTIQRNSASGKIVGGETYIVQAVPERNNKMQVSDLKNTSSIQIYDGSILSVFPNPTTDNLLVKYRSGGASSGYITVSSIDGKTMIYPINVQDNQISLDLSEYSNGMYFITLVSDDAVVKSVKIYKK